MRAVVQRVSSAAVAVAGATTGSIGPGLLVLLGVGKSDEEADVATIVGKVADLRIFEDAAGRMNLSVGDVGGEVLVVSQFTLYADCRRGRRPSFDDAAPADRARELYEGVVSGLRARRLAVVTGQFRATMTICSANEGPVTLLLDSRRAF